MIPAFRGGQTGAIAKNGVELFKQYDYSCIMHPKPILMKATHVEEVIKVEVMTEYKIPSKTFKVEPDVKTLPKTGYRLEKWITLGKTCPKCFQYIKEGEYQDD